MVSGHHVVEGHLEPAGACTRCFAQRTPQELSSERSGPGSGAELSFPSSDTIRQRRTLLAGGYEPGMRVGNYIRKVKKIMGKFNTGLCNFIPCLL